MTEKVPFWQIILDYGWHGNLPLLLGSVAILSLLIYRFSPESRATLRNTLTFLLFSLAGLFVSGLFAALDYPTVASVLHTAFIFAQGAALIRLTGLFIFRIFLSLLDARPPSILEEILVVIAYFGWVMVLLHRGGLNIGEIVTTSAVVTAVLAFAMQDTLGNILGGLALQWDHSLKRGDWIRIGDIEGRIVDIRWRALLVETRNWETVVIPNGMVMKNQFKVLGERTGEPVKWRRWIWFNIDYTVPPARVVEVAERAVLSANIPNVAGEPSPNCLMMNYEDSVARYALRYWLTDLAKDDPTDSAVRLHIFDGLRRAGMSPAIPRQHMHLTKESEKFQKRQHLRELQHLAEILGDVDLFEALTESELNKLSESLEYCPFAEGDVITRQGDVDHWFYIIVDGTVQICVQRGDQPNETIYTLGAGDFFGEHGVLTGKPRSATAIAGSEVECYRLGAEAFSRIFESRTELLDEISRTMASRLGVLERAKEKIRSELDAERVLQSHSELAVKIRKFLGLH